MKHILHVLLSVYLISSSFFTFSDGCSCSNSSRIPKILFLNKENSLVVFETKPYDYEVDSPTLVTQDVPLKLLYFSAQLANLPTDFASYFADHYFDIFSETYPGLRHVPIHPKDVECLVIFILLYLNRDSDGNSDDVSFFPATFQLLVRDLSHVLKKDGSPILEHFANGFSEDSTRAALRTLFEMAMKENYFYTVEAFFATGLEGFTNGTLQLAIKASELTGDFRLLRRITSQLNVYTRLWFLRDEYTPLWPVHNGSLISKMQSVDIDLISIHDFGNPVNFYMDRILGKGGFGECWQVSSICTGKPYAMKVISKELVLKIKPHRSAQLRKEIMIQHSLSHECIVSLNKVFEDSNNVYLLMEMCHYDLQNVSIDTAHIKDVLRQILPALDYLHRNGIVHRDIKPGNIFVQEPGFRVKIGDFGISHVISNPDEKLRVVCGTWRFIAPEIYTGKGYRFEVDIWSLGVTLYYLLTKQYPFLGDTRRDLIRNIVHIRYCFPKDCRLSESAIDLIQKIFTNSQTRISIDDMLSHPYLSTTELNNEAAPVSVCV